MVTSVIKPSIPSLPRNRWRKSGPADIAQATGAAIGRIIEKYEHVVLGEKPVQHWIIHRNDVCNDMANDEYFKFGLVADTCEISACWSSIGKIYSAVLERAPGEIPSLFGMGGHSSHSYMQGTNIYFQFGFTPRSAEAAQEDYMALITIIMEETLRYGGSIAHHHGSGKYRTAWMPQEHGSSYPLMYKLKEALDPTGILNSGILLVDKA